MKNRLCLLLFACLAFVASGRAAATSNGSYSYNGVKSGLGPVYDESVSISGALTKTRQDIDSGVMFFFPNAGAKHVQFGTPISARVRVFTVPGSLAVNLNSDLEYPLTEGVYDVYTEVNWGGWQLWPETLVRMTISFRKTATIKSRAANYDLLYIFTDALTGKQVGRRIVPAGEVADLTFTTDTGGDVVWQAILENHTLSGDVPVPASGQQIIAAGGTVSASQMRRQGASGNGTNYAGEAVQIDGIRSASGASLTVTNTGGPSAAVGVVSGGTTSGATNETVAASANGIIQAVDRSRIEQVSALAQVRAAIAAGGGGGSGGGASTDMTGTNARLDVLATKAETGNTALGSVVTNTAATSTKLDGIGTKLDAVATNTADMKTAADGMKTAVEEVRDVLKPAGRDDYVNPSAALATGAAQAAGQSYGGSKVGALSPAGVGTIGDAPGVLASFHIGNRDVEFDTGNFPGRSILVAGRALILIALAVGFLRRSGDDVSQYIIGLSGVDQASSNMGPENLVPGASQAKTWGGAGAVCVAVFAFLAAAVAAVDSAAAAIVPDVSIADLTGALSLSTLAAGLGLANMVFPVAAAVQFMLLDAARPYFLAPVYVAAVATVKFAKA